jgi:hypothetical protein
MADLKKKRKEEERLAENNSLRNQNTGAIIGATLPNPFLKQDDPIQPPQNDANKERLRPMEEPEPIFDPEGRVTGVRLPDGRTLQGNKYDVQGLIADFYGQGKQQLTQQKPSVFRDAAVMDQERFAAQQQNITLAKLSGSLRQINPSLVAEAQATPLNYRQAAQEALGNAATYAIGGAIAAAPAAVATGGLAPVGAAVVGGAGGFLNAFRASLKQQQTEAFAISTAGLADRKEILTKTIYLVNKDPANADEYVSEFKNQMALAEHDWARLNKQTQVAGAGFLGDASKEHAEFIRFFEQGGADAYFTRMNLALASPDPNAPLPTSSDIV